MSIFLKGASHGYSQNILSMMNKLHYSLLEAMKILDVDESEYSIYEEKLNGLKQL